jgi:formylglycine-generating enzyme required for sulfatase activity
MSPVDAAKLLEVAPDATPEQIETRFLALQARLEDKIAKAPTPGLKVKYRESLAEITTAFETLTLAADASTLPVLQRQEAPKAPAVGGVPSPRDSSAPVRSTASAGTPEGKPSAAKRAGSREFALVAIIALAVLGVGGWWVVKTRADNAEKERLAAEAKAMAEQKAAADKQAADNARLAKEAADKAEKDRLDRQATQARTRLAELNVLFDAANSAQQTADRELSDLQSQVRDLRGATTPEARMLTARQQAQDKLVTWMRDNLPAHPARIAKAKAEQLVSLRADTEMGPALDSYASAITQLQGDIAKSRQELLVITGPVRIASSPAGLSYEATDAFGRSFTGVTPATLDLALGSTKISVRSATWPDIVRNVAVQRGENPEFVADFASLAGSLRVTSNPVGLGFEATDARGLSFKGTTPASLELALGGATVKISRPGWPDFSRNLTIQRGDNPEITAEFPSGTFELASTPSGAAVWRNGQRLGVTPYRTELQPGRHDFELRLTGYESKALTVTVTPRQIVPLIAELEKIVPPEPGQPWTLVDLKLTLQPIAAGSFMMGRSAGEKGLLRDQGPQTQVTLTKPFWLGKTEVTQAQWEALMGQNPSHFKGPSLPVETVSYYDAIEFCMRLTERERKAGRLPEGYAYTLPTEAQWEYAARAGTTGPYAGSLDTKGWYSVNSGYQTHSVGEKQANGWGLQDMQGNVEEWCLDWKAYHLPGGSVTDPRGPASGAMRTLRGGSWAASGPDNGLDDMRLDYRADAVPSFRGQVLGFRLALSSNP